MIEFKKLFEVKFFHGFYDMYTSKDINVVLPIETLKLISMYSLVYRATADGFVVLYKSGKAKLLRDIKSKTRFSFYLEIQNRHFANYTLLDYKLNKEKFYFDNIGTEIHDVKMETDFSGLLHIDKFVSARDRLDTVQPDSHLSAITGQEELVLEKEGEIHFKGSLGEADLTAQTLGSNYGLYYVSAGDMRKELYYTPSCAPQVFGIVDLFLGGNENLTLENVSKRSYKIRFDSRSVHWTYFFVSNSGKTFDKIKIESGKNRLEFSESKTKTLINGALASVVSSMEPIPLKKNYNGDKLFATISNSSSEFNEKRIRLPMPDIKKIKGYMTSGQQKFFSAMYVYV